MKHTCTLIMLAGLLLFSVGCKKDKTTSPTSKTTKELLIGEWIINHEGDDDNGNGTLEDSEKEIRNHDYHLKFEDNGTALRFFTTNATQFHYTWTIDGDKITLVEAGADNKTLEIEVISETELRYRYMEYFTLSGYWTWRMYDRK